MRILHWAGLIFFCTCAAFLLCHPQWAARFLIGLTLAAAAFPLWLLARIQLGSSFSVQARATALVTTGLYSKIRHPIYVFGGLAFLGLFLAYKLWIALVWFLLQLPIQIVRIRKEEAALQRAFGNRYQAYKAGTWF